jgi:DNA-binding MarR family transcriptional regulator
METRVSQEELRTCSVPDSVRQLIGLFPRVIRGFRRHKEPGGGADDFLRAAKLGKRHGWALFVLLDGPKTVGELAGELELGLASASGVVAELDHAGLVERKQDEADRRRTIVSIRDEQRRLIESWLTYAAGPLQRVLERLTPEERATFVRAMAMLEHELATGTPADESPG